MKKMKRFGALILALALAWSLTACGGSGSSGTSVLPTLNGGSGASSADSSDGAYSEGRLGDVMRTYFFAFTVNSVYTCDSFGDFAPEEGKQVLVAEVSVKNTFTVGNIQMTLTETDIKDPTGDRVTSNEYKIYPGQTYPKEERWQRPRRPRRRPARWPRGSYTGAPSRRSRHGRGPARRHKCRTRAARCCD